MTAIVVRKTKLREPIGTRGMPRKLPFRAQQRFAMLGPRRGWLRHVRRISMTQTTERSNRFVLAMLAILGAVVAVYCWYRFLA